MIGLRAGVRPGVRPGLAAGLGSDPKGSGVTAFTTKDAASTIFTPATVGEFSAAGFVNPDALWLLQEASGNPADSGPSGFTLTAAGTGISYQNAVTGWSRKAINTTDAGTGTLGTTAAGLPDVSTTSCFVLAYIQVSTPLAVRAVMVQGTTMQSMRVNTTPRYNFLGPNSIVGTNDPTGSVRPVAIKIDRTGSVETGYDNQQKYSPAFSATPTGKQIGFGAFGANSATASYLWAAAWFGAKAEAMTDAVVKSMLIALGWSIPWT